MEYDDWKTGYWEAMADITKDERSDERRKLENASYWLESILERLYGPEELDKFMLACDLDELAHQLGVKMPKTQIKDFDVAMGQ